MSMKHKTLMARLIAGALALVLAAGIGMTPAMASSEGPLTFDHDFDDYGGDLGGESSTSATNTTLLR